MTTQSFLIGPIKDGLRKEVKPYAIPEDAFEVLINAYQWRGRIVRRPGYKSLGRLANGTPVMGLRTRELFGIKLQELVAFDTTQSYHLAAGSFVPLPSTMPTIWSGTDYQFFFTTNYAGAFWATNFKPGLHGVAIAAPGISNTNPAIVTTLVNHGYTTGQFVTIINVSGFTSTTLPALNGRTFLIGATTPNTFELKNLDGSTFDGTLYTAYSSGGFALNNQVSQTGQDGIRYYATTNVGDTWVNYNPPIDANMALAGALMIFPYRGYLVFLNTWEGNGTGSPINYGNRARWTQIGTPYYSNPAPTSPETQSVDPNAARDDLFGRGGANDAPTNEVIVSAAFIRDILVVEFERSTWRLRFVNNSQNPFVWERVNIELGSQSTFSAIAFDKGLMTIGNRGIIISDGNDTSRFDEKIPDDIFQIRQKNNGLNRVYGIRTFRTRLLYWTFPSDTNVNGIFPDKVLVYNYETKNWSYFDDCFTCFGYFYPNDNSPLTWNDLDKPWNSYSGPGDTWASGTNEGGYETIVAGNQQGFVFELEQDEMTNDPSLAITGILGSTITSLNHNLKEGDWIKITGVTGTTLADGTSLNDRNFKITNPSLNANTFLIQEFKAIAGGNASGLLYIYSIAYTPILPGSVQINVGALTFKDINLDGNLFTTIIPTVPEGTIDYKTGAVRLNFSPPIASTPVNIRVVSLNETQPLSVADTTGGYTGGGLITKISNIDIQSKIFNFFNDDKRCRLSQIDFYVSKTQNGQFTCNVFPDSSDIPGNKPLADNLQSNVVVTQMNPYQIGAGDQTIYRLFADVIAQTFQLQFNLSDRQMAIDVYNSSNIEITALMIKVRKGGRLV